MSEITRIPTQYSFSKAVVAGDYVFLGHHRAWGDTFAAQLAGTMTGLKETLAQVGLTLDHIVKVNVWLKSISDVPEMERLFNDYFEPGHFPARMSATTQFIDADCLLMIEAVAYRK